MAHWWDRAWAELACNSPASGTVMGFKHLFLGQRFHQWD